ncbi:MAG: tRNA (adenosine(37)-N6)-threonylcarbamoyltransferase complex transferase subunit TsaD [Deltaproteobacteria bacterium RIFOXYD12_FULL_57_12]|nr:MAG: tRNA (adenosine(37)-N6)-threonylcarbamoyltransferase complex transferase subunit TsaD [Deltaproteobacteria bacterium RIFOXYD12_FULL_57_12]
MLILGIESSCDETAAAVLKDGTVLLSDVIASQIDVHCKYGGVVPELASRKHVEAILPVVQEALSLAGVPLSRIDGLAVTNGPGLVGSLLVGLSFVKAVSLATRIPYVGVDHLAGHLLSVFLGPDKPTFPYVALVVSGGHSSIFQVTDPLSYRLLGRTRDDAAGEAFDKVAKLLGLSYPGGPAIAALAARGDAKAIPFPRAWLEAESLDFSFSGIKTAVVNYVAQQQPSTKIPPAEYLNLPDICASFQEAVAEVLVEKTLRAARDTGAENIVLAGGVAANQRLRQLIEERGQQNGFKVFLPLPRFCTDNGAMIALAGHHNFTAGKTLAYDMDVYSRSKVIAGCAWPGPNA